MSRRKQTGPASHGKRTDVGYGRPPREHQFKPGQSGNKGGRPKGSKNEATIINELLNRKISIRYNGRVRRISALEGILTRFVDDALKGKDKSAAFLLNRKQQAESSEPPAAPQLDIDDRKVLDAYAQQLREQFKKQGDSE
ncbi:hypothetical protein XH99_02840 [Bradyrhizobium nanningense]|uniref:DUF5681 domain-containing protein n=1 Tax=Bradyrhizobium nanningense TaxID=1325118 RepID=A0A4Q0SDA9_9BRAD|nr:DUF5681 domain-containing protein [Bradyrhizobium nanningense]RXH25795.1 hypothetical protein XH84_30985 [Bradyrhizobium nanningense]RXH37111.1 hypothetical protein XH99_02840 [Bradyrhizobium nanningense]